MTKIWLICSYLVTNVAHGALLLSEKEHHWISEHPVIVYQSNGTWPVDFHRNGRHVGLVRDYLDVITELTGLTFVESQQTPPSLASSPVWVIPAVSPKFSSLSKKWTLTDAYVTVSALVVTQTDKPSVYALRQLEGRTLAIQKTTFYRDWLHKKHPNIRLMEYDDGLQALQAVKTGAAYAALGAELSIRPLLQRYFTTTLAIAGYPPEAYTGVHMAVSAEHPELHSILNKVLISLSAQQTDAIFKRWIDELELGMPPVSTIFYYYSGEAALLIVFLIILSVALYQARQARMRAEDSEAEKSRFLAVMSHEIRTPMNAVMASLELLQRPESSNQKEYISLARTSAEGLMELLNDILDYSRLESGQLSLNLITFELKSFLQEVYDSHYPSSIQKGLELRLDCPINEMWVITDSQRLKQILHNLLSNAIKFTEKGKVVLAVDLQEEEGKSLVLVFRVEDQGPGIPQSEQRRLFKAWQQADNSVTRRHGGSGLGLYICQQLAHLMGGSLRLASQVGEGTRVFLTLQVERCLPQESESQNNEKALPRFTESMSVLVVEDHPVNQRLLTDQLEVMGCHSEVAENGLAALRLIAEENYYSAVLLDCNLPDMSGYMVARKIRAFESRMERERTPIIAISAMSDNQHLIRTQESGMDDVLFKPIRLQSLADTLLRWCQADVETTVSTPLIVQPSIGAREYLEEDLREFTVAVELKDQSRMHHYSHRIKGVALMIGLTKLAALATLLEKRLSQGEGMSIEEGEEWKEKLQAHIMLLPSNESPRE
ncbi:ATP-binding protein [Aeromonas sp. R7-5]|uniref:ATP-binding protein n=1 Tax=Aeromonas sp. R7-5 TaxID=3138477 RepID=UPI0034A46C96